jgi:MFS family permease
MSLTEKNRAIVHRFVNLFYGQKNVRQAFLKYVAEDYIHHNPNIPDGRAAIAFLEPMYCFKMGQSMTFGSRQWPCRARPGFWPWNQCKKIASGGKWKYIGSQPKVKTEIPGRLSMLTNEIRKGVATMTVSAQASSFRWLVLIAAILGIITLQVDNLSITPVLPQVAASLNINLGTASNLTMTTFLFAACVVQMLIGGLVCDKLGVIAGILMGALCAAAPMALMPWIGHSATGLALARAVEGFSGGFMFPAMGTIIGLWFPDRQKGLAGGLMSASVAVGSAAGVLLGPAVIPHVSSWQSMNAVLSLPGWITFAFALVLAILPKPALGTHGGPDSATVKRAVLSRLTLFGALIAFMASWGMQCLYGLTATYLSADKPVGVGYGPMSSAQLMLGATLLAGIVGPLVCGLLLDKVFKGNAKVVFLIGFALMCVFVYLLTVPFVTGSFPVLEIVLILAGFGVQLTIPTIYYFVARAYAPQVVGIMSGVWMGIGTFGGALGFFVAGVTIKSQNSYYPSLVMQSLTALIGFLLVFALSAAHTAERRTRSKLSAVAEM